MLPDGKVPIETEKPILLHKQDELFSLHRDLA